MIEPAGKRRDSEHDGGRGRLRDLIVIGGSSGGIRALRELLAALPTDLPAAVLVVLHRLPVAESSFAEVLGGGGRLPVREAVDGEALTRGQVLVAPPDHHLGVKGERVRVVRGPRENRHRPAIDPLFRSAAVEHTTRVVGVLLTGLLNDGTAGLMAVKRCGGIALVQDPADAEFPEMPVSALRRLEVDHVAGIRELARVLPGIVRSPAPPPAAPPAELVAETRSGLAEAEERVPPPGDLVPLSCPDCFGPLTFRREDDLGLYRCQVGHAFTEEALAAGQERAIEQSLWVALRSLEERAMMLETMAERRSGEGVTQRGLEARAEEAREHAARIRALLTSGMPALG